MFSHHQSCCPPYRLLQVSIHAVAQLDPGHIKVATVVSRVLLELGSIQGACSKAADSHALAMVCLEINLAGHRAFLEGAVVA